MYENCRIETSSSCKRAKLFAYREPGVVMTSNKKKYHFIGIGGSGMSGVAQICLAQGYPVSGSDLKKSMATSRLESNGAIISFPHNHSNITEDPVVVVSSAIPETNEELSFARRKGLPL